MDASTGSARVSGRTLEALRSIEAYWEAHGKSPRMQDIADELGIGLTRAKQLVHRLALAQMIERDPGAARGITVPGLFRRLVVEEVRRLGGMVDGDFADEGGCPRGQLPIVAILAHTPDPEPGESGDDDHERGTRAAAGGAPGAGAAAAEGESARAA